MIGIGAKAREKQERQLAALTALPVAHRGLHSPGGPLENTIPAFDAAIEAGLAIELDVQLTAEASAVVFHDATLDRLTDGTGPVVAYPIAELGKIKLKGSDQNICPLQDVLHHISGRVPLLIEAKAGENSPVALALAIRRALEGYTGPVGVMSFNPDVSRWFHDHFPAFLNGLVVSEEPDSLDKSWKGSGLSRWMTLKQAKPKFLAYDVRSLPSRIAASYRKPGKRVLSWTVRTEDDLKKTRDTVDQVIVEGAAAELMKRSAGTDAPEAGLAEKGTANSA
ncbi:MAG: glycerophosphodiester phosphodiesterase family protein [Pacificimonas sp.]|jgi:glycerophosphoryl diester phosphodiesterase|nr:glycerophosphodiester phosphodiesterase family protein [Pacificimonas sp.]